MLGGFGFILLFLTIGEAIALTGIGLPGNVIGMVMLALALAVGVVKLDAVKPASDVLLKNLAFFFIPAGVGVMVHGKVIAANWIAITVSVVVSFLVVLVTVGLMQKLLTRRRLRTGPRNGPRDQSEKPS